MPVPEEDGRIVVVFGRGGEGGRMDVLAQAADAVPDRAWHVLGPVTGILGSLAALEAIRALVPFGDDPAGQLLLIDTLAFRFRTLKLPKDPGCASCGAMAPA